MASRVVLLRAGAIVAVVIAAGGNISHTFWQARHLGQTDYMSGVISMLPDLMLIMSVTLLTMARGRSVWGWAGIAYAAGHVGWAGIAESGTVRFAWVIASVPLLVAVLGTGIYHSATRHTAVTAVPAPERIEHQHAPEPETEPGEYALPALLWADIPSRPADTLTMTFDNTTGRFMPTGDPRDLNRGGIVSTSGSWTEPDPAERVVPLHSVPDQLDDDRREVIYGMWRNAQLAGMPWKPAKLRDELQLPSYRAAVSLAQRWRRRLADEQAEGQAL